MWRAVLRTREGRIGVPLGGLMLIVILLGRFVAPYPAVQIGLGTPASPPSSAPPLGIDALGRDVLSRFLTGGTPVLVTPLAAVSLSFLIGGALGMLAAYRGGRGGPGHPPARSTSCSPSPRCSRRSSSSPASEPRRRWSSSPLGWCSSREWGG